MKNTLLLVALLVGFASCGINQDNKNGTESESINSQIESSGVQQVANKEQSPKGYQLMVQKCFICHFERPDPSKRDQMIAPPMLRVQEHYKPTYPEKEAFVKAVMNIVKEPSEENTLMPGTIKKFNLMPKLVYEEAELRLIAEALYDHDFGQAPKRGRGMTHGNIQLKKGKKWDLSDKSMAQIDAVMKKIIHFQSNDIAAYNQLGKDIFEGAKGIMLEKEYTGDLFDQIHNFFGGVEPNMHTLISTKSLEEAKKELATIRKKFKEFYQYFE